MIPPKGKNPVPVDLAVVIDTSGSMCSAATSPGKGNESTGLSILDLVKHATRTLIHSLGPNDRLSIIAFSTSARVVLRLTQMTPSGKEKALLALKPLTPAGSTNLWDGLLKGMESVVASDGSGRFSSVMLLTDGEPTIVPPRGHLPMLRRYIDKQQSFRTVVSTFGFGYSLDSKLLHAIANEANGSYAFIPDAGFIGTIFVHAVATLKSMLATGFKLAIEGARIVPLPKTAADDGDDDENDIANVIAGGYAIAQTSWGAEISPGSRLFYGQAREFLLRVDDNCNPSNIEISAKYFHRFSKSKPVVLTCSALQNSSNNTFADVEARLILIDSIRNGLERAIDGDLAGAQDVVAKGILSLKAYKKPSKYIKDLLRDAKGQLTEATSKQEWFMRWGRHYLPSLGLAHASQTCNNFKDPGVQHMEEHFSQSCEMTLTTRSTNYRHPSRVEVSLGELVASLVCQTTTIATMDAFTASRRSVWQMVR